MNRTELIIVTAIVVFLAIVVGWFAHWLFRRFIRVQGAELSDIDWLAKALQEAEETRDHAIEHLKWREAELLGKLNEAKAETRAAMESLRTLRQEAGELRAYIERVHRSQ